MDVAGSGLARQDEEKKSIDSFISSLITSSVSDCIADPQFGFVFNSFAFENFNEREGRIANVEQSQDKKISGSSRSIDTFASDLCRSVTVYEKRISDVSATMTYIVQERNIYIEIKGTLVSTGQPYVYNTTIRVWK